MAVNAAASSWMLSQPASKSERRSPFAAPYSWKAMLSCPEPPRASSLPAPPSTQSVPALPLRKSLPAPPLTVSEPSPPRSESLPSRPLMTSLSAPPVMVSLPFVPLKVAMSDYPDVGRRDGCATLYSCNELRIGAALSVGVVVELPGRGIEDDAIVGVVAAARAGGGVEACIARRKVSRAAERREGARVEAHRVPVRIEAADRVGVRRAVFAEDVAILAGAAGDAIVAASAFNPVVARVAEDRVVAAAADQRVVA